MDKKGLSIGINMIVIISIALIVLLVVTGYFLGGFKKTGEGMKGVGKGAETKAGEQDVEGKVKGLGQGMWKKENIIAKWECKNIGGTWKYKRIKGSIGDEFEIGSITKSEGGCTSQWRCCFSDRTPLCEAPNLYNALWCNSGQQTAFCECYEIV